VIQDVWAPPDPPGDGRTTPDLRHCAPEGRDWARQALAAGHAHACLVSVEDYLWMDFLLANLSYLHTQGLYETVLLQAYQGAKGNLRGYPRDLLFSLVTQADPARLRAASEAVPEPLPTTLYRGVAGAKRVRRVQGLSWTSALGCACWFAQRFPLPDPAVYQLPVASVAILAYSNDRREEEYLLWPVFRPRPRRLALTPEEMAVRGAQWKQAP
jgi:hypothetical protein